MIEICLNPDNETIGGETFESVDSEVNPSGTRDTLDMAIRTADKLLKVIVLYGSIIISEVKLRCEVEIVVTIVN